MITSCYYSTYNRTVVPQYIDFGLVFELAVCL